MDIKKIVTQNIFISNKVEEFLKSFDFAREELNKEDFKFILEKYIKKVLNQADEKFEPLMEYLEIIRRKGEPMYEDENILSIKSVGHIYKNLKDASVWVNVIEDKYYGKYKIYITLKPDYVGDDISNILEKEDVKYKIKGSKNYILEEVAKGHERDLFNKLNEQIEQMKTEM